MSNNCFNLINKLYFERVGGSTAEERARNIIVDTCKEFGAEARIETFDIDTFETKECELYFEEIDLSPFVVAAGNGASTIEEGIEKEFVIVSSLTQANMIDLKDKICMYPQRYIDNKLLSKLKQSEIAGLILCRGSVYDTEYEIDNILYDYKDFENIPTVYIPLKYGNDIAKANPKKVKLKSIQTKVQKQSANIIVDIKGTNKPEETIVFTAHYDTVPFSKGAYDNASGCAMIMDILKHFTTHRTNRSLRFIWCGSEETGLNGSENYVKTHIDELNDVKLCVNIDMTGLALGIDYAEVTAETGLVNYIKYLSSEKGFPIEAVQKVYSSDSTSFADKGIPAVSFIRRTIRGGAEIHCKRDIIENLSEHCYLNTLEFIIEFVERMTNSVSFPVKREIPKEMKDELDNYYKRNNTQNSI